MRNTIYCLLCALCLAASGCGGKVATNMVEGTITMDGAPLADATITFSPVSQGSGMIGVGTSDAEGKFTLQTVAGAIGKGTTAGEYTIFVTKTEAVPTGNTSTADGGEIVREVEDKSLIPEQYTKASTSPIKQTIVKGLNKVEIKLLSKP